MTAHLSIAIILVLSAIGCASTSTLERATGAIAGTVCGDIGGIPGAHVIINGVDPSRGGAVTSSDGRFLLMEVPPGRYSLRASAINHHRQRVLQVRVAPDSVSIVSFPMLNSALQIIPPDGYWVETDSTLIELRRFIQSGALFEMRCR